MHRKASTALLLFVGVASFAGVSFLWAPRHASDTVGDTPQVGRRLQQSSGGGGSPASAAVPTVAVFTFVAVFYCLVSSKYQPVGGPNADSKRIMEEGSACRIKPGFHCCFSCCCNLTAIAHNLNATGTMNYWVAVLFGCCCPCIINCVALSCTDHNEKLGGEKKNAFVGCLEGVCCGCCVNAQWMEAADAATGQTTSCCSVTRAREAEYGELPDDATTV